MPFTSATLSASRGARRNASRIFSTRNGFTMAMICFMGGKAVGRRLSAFGQLQIWPRADSREPTAPSSAKEIFAEQVQLRSGFHLNVAVHFDAAGKPHRVFIADVGHTRERVGNGIVKPKFLEHSHWASVVHA